MTLGNSTLIDDLKSAVRGDNRISSAIEQDMKSYAMACSKGDKNSCYVIGAGSVASVLWRIDKVLIDIASRGRTSKSRKATKILKKARRILKNSKKTSTSNRSNNRSHQKNYTLILPQRNINGHKVLIYIMSPRANSKAFIQVDNHKISMVRNGGFRSTAKILSLLPKNLRNSRLIRKKITSAKIRWRNQTR